MLLALAISVFALAVPTESRATCAVPRAEPPLLVTPTGSTVPAGGVVLVYLSTDAEPYQFVLVAEGTQTRVPMTRRAITSRLYALEVPATTSPGAHAIEARRPDRGSGGPYSPGAIVVGGSLPTASLVAPRGRIVVRETPGRWSPNRSASLVLQHPAPSDAAVVFRWTDAGAEHGNARWLVAGEDAVMVASGHCGTYPFGTTVPSRGQHVEVAFVDARGALGPVTTLVVGR
jgi:hypothetical protein